MNDEQRNFIVRYMNNRGDFYKTIDDMGLEFQHIQAWRENKEFDDAYRKAKRDVIRSIKEDNQIIALRELNHVLLNGVVQTSIKKTHVVTEDGLITGYQITSTTKKLGVPIAAIKQALEETSIINAVNCLASEGVLPNIVAKRILNSASTIQQNIIDAFDMNAKDNDRISENQAINLIKKALLASKEG